MNTREIEQKLFADVFIEEFKRANNSSLVFVAGVNTPQPFSLAQIEAENALSLFRAFFNLPQRKSR